MKVHHAGFDARRCASTTGGRGTFARRVSGAARIRLIARRFPAAPAATGRSGAFYGAVVAALAAAAIGVAWMAHLIPH